MRENFVVVLNSSTGSVRSRTERKNEREDMASRHRKEHLSSSKTADGMVEAEMSVILSFAILSSLPWQLSLEQCQSLGVLGAGSRHSLRLQIGLGAESDRHWRVTDRDWAMPAVVFFWCCPVALVWAASWNNGECCLLLRLFPAVPCLRLFGSVLPANATGEEHCPDVAKTEQCLGNEQGGFGHLGPVAGSSPALSQSHVRLQMRSDRFGNWQMGGNFRHESITPKITFSSIIQQCVK